MEKYNKKELTWDELFELSGKELKPVDIKWGKVKPKKPIQHQFDEKGVDLDYERFIYEKGRAYF